MDDKERLAVLENVLVQMLKPVRGIPFDVIIKSLSENTVIKFDPKAVSYTHLDVYKRQGYTAMRGVDRRADRI